MGQAPEPIVLIPGLLCSWRLYAEQLPALRRLGPVTVADHRRDDSMAALAGRVLAEAPPRFRLVGLSMGGYLAFEIMRRAPERVSRLALLDTTARPDTTEQTRRRQDQVARTQEGQFPQVVDDLYHAWVRPSRRDDAMRRAVLQMAEETGPDAFVRQQAAIMGRADSRPDLAGIGCPTLVLGGADDELTTPAHAGEIADGVPGATLVVVPDCGHLSTLEQPGAVTGALLEWLSS
jgi:pimeloyl-ACP methyl ester carboxylesterase